MFKQNGIIPDVIKKEPENKLEVSCFMYKSYAWSLFVILFTVGYFNGLAAIGWLIFR